MSEAAREVLELALTLPPEDRARLARALCESLEEPEASAAVDTAWRDEVRRRLADVVREGKTYAPWDETLAKAERRLDERRRARNSG